MYYNKYYAVFLPIELIFGLGVDHMYKDKYDRFFEHRKSLIVQYNQGDLTKEEFIEANYNYIQSMNTKAFRKVDNMLKGIFNYQYYNVLAKYYQKLAHESPKKSTQRKDFLDKANYFYKRKDQTTLKILELLDFRGVDAYYVSVHSNNLKNKLFEIVLLDYDHLILHSVNEKIRLRLEEECVFRNEKRKSIVDDYINERY